MKKLILMTLIAAGLFTACQNSRTTTDENKNVYGVAIDSTVVPMLVAEMKDALDTMPKMDATVTGKVASVCQKEGCWLKLDAGNNETLFMNWDHKFTVPKDIAGKTVIATGYAYHDTTSIEQLKEYAKDDNKSQAAIDSITQPKIEVKFLATGLVIK